MIVLDTNVISELAHQVPDAGVLSWLDSLEATHYYVQVSPCYVPHVTQHYDGPPESPMMGLVQGEGWGRR